MKRGARSIRGALGTYLWVSSAAVVLLGLVLWMRPGLPPELTELRMSDGWEGALLEQDGQSWELRPGSPQRVPPGRYRVTLFGAGAPPVRQQLEVLGEFLEVGLVTEREAGAAPASGDSTVGR